MLVWKLEQVLWVWWLVWERGLARVVGWFGLGRVARG